MRLCRHDVGGGAMPGKPFTADLWSRRRRRAAAVIADQGCGQRATRGQPFVAAAPLRLASQPRSGYARQCGPMGHHGTAEDQP
jgi:hypothetical protein